MTNTSAQTYAREDDGLGSLKARRSAAHLAEREATYRLECRALSDAYAAARKRGDYAEANEIKVQGTALIRAHLGGL